MIESSGIAMNHTTIEESHVVDRYVMGTLPPDEAERFEEHYLSCPECLDRLALAETMQRGFKRAAGQDVARLAVTRQLALVAWLSRLSRSRQAAALFLALLVIAILPGGLTLWQLGRSTRQLAEIRRTLDQEREQSAAGAHAAAEVEKLRSALDASRHDLTQEQQARQQAAKQLAQTTEQLAQARVPQVNVPLLYLDVARGGPDEAPNHALRQPPAASWVFLSLPLDSSTSPSYRAILRDAQGRELWSGEGLLPIGDQDAQSLNLSLPGSLLAPGNYTLVVEGVGGPKAPPRRFPFQVRPR